MAIIADGDRSALLHRIAVPTQVMHGRDDPLVPVAAAHDLAAKIPAATLDIIDGWGHDLPVPLWPRFVQVIEGAAARA
jgi:pimeloyl-ACP methyl ester carboxylesterase